MLLQSLRPLPCETFGKKRLSILFTNDSLLACEPLTFPETDLFAKQLLTLQQPDCLVTYDHLPVRAICFAGFQYWMLAILGFHPWMLNGDNLTVKINIIKTQSEQFSSAHDTVKEKSYRKLHVCSLYCLFQFLYFFRCVHIEMIRYKVFAYLYIFGRVCFNVPQFTRYVQSRFENSVNMADWFSFKRFATGIRLLTPSIVDFLNRGFSKVLKLNLPKHRDNVTVNISLVVAHCSRTVLNTYIVL